MHLFGRFLAAVVLMVVVPVMASEQADDLFTVPDNLKTNVTFWKAIYTSISLRQGLLHDRDYPLIIYDTINLGSESRSSSAQAEESRLKIEGALDKLVSGPSGEWGPLELRIKALFDQYAPPEAIAGAKERIRFQLGQKERFLKGLERSGMYIDTIRAIFAQYNIPARIAYLPHVESSFDYKAYSKVGAAGLWQFMRYTGRDYLKINYQIDERLDPILETFAAAKLLSYNYREIQSWPLAITAYNHGLNGMKRAVNATGSRDIAVIVEKYESPSFRFASKNFYSCFLAASEIAADPVPYFGQVKYLPKAQHQDMVLTHYIKPSVISAYLGVAESVIRELNPALRPVVFQQQKPIPEGYVLRIPLSIAADVAVKTVEVRIPDSLKTDQPVESQYYRVRRGDNLSVIAEQFGVGAEQLAQENDISAKKKIYAGQMLRIPVKGAAKPAAAVVAAAPEPVPPPHPLDERGETAATPAPSVQPPQPVRQPAVARVAAAARQAADTMRAILAATADTVPEVVPSAKNTDQIRLQLAGFDVEIYTLETTVSSDGSSAEITVTVDETVGHYADWLRTPSQEIRRLNRIGSKGNILIGKRLHIPAGKEGALAAFSRARLEYHMALEEDFYIRYKVTDVNEHVVRRGETLWDICGGDEVPLWLFKKHNKHVDLGTLIPGSRVWIPVIESKTEEDVARESMKDGGVHPVYFEPVRRGPGTVQLLP